MSRFLLSTGAVALALLSASAGLSSAQVKVQRNVEYNGNSHNIRISNGKIELVLATDFGPRILRAAFVGSGTAGNLFATIPGVSLHTAYGDWRIRGGERIWHAPENIPGSYVPDNSPVKVVQDGGTIKLIQPTEKPTGIAKEIWITLSPASNEVTVVYKLTNHSLKPVNMAVWALGAMNSHGKAIFPQEPFVRHSVNYKPSHTLTLWSYTSMGDPRWMWGSKYITLTQNVKAKYAVKIGIAERMGWAAYYHNKALIIKKFAYHNGDNYPDDGCNVESFTNSVFLELETLGPLETVQPEKSITHTEHWFLFNNVSLGQGEAGLNRALMPRLKQAGK